MRVRHETIERAVGRWRAILPAITNIGPQFLTGKHGPCPMCGGKDRWRFDDKEGRGTWFCTHCGAGTGMQLVMRQLGIDFFGAARLVDGVVGTVPRIVKKINNRAVSIDRLWETARPVTWTNPVALYLENRGFLYVAGPENIRYVPDLRYKINDKISSFHPAMLARFDGPDGKMAAIQRLYLTDDGHKANVESPRMTLGSLAKGGAVRLRLDYLKGRCLGIAEGIETALSATLLDGIPCWAALNTAGMMAWEPPEGIEDVIIFGDNDKNYAGQAAAYALAAKLAGRFAVQVRIPSAAGADWNDVLMGRTA